MPPENSEPRPRLMLAATILASTLGYIDESVVNVSLPAIGRSLTAGGAGLSWAINAYLLPLSALLLVGGAAGDLFGRRRLLLWGIGVFAAASALCAVAPTYAWFLIGRITQGCGAAMLIPNSLAILGANFSGEERGRAVGIWAAVGAVAGAAGPVLGGALVDLIGWRAVFLINLPIAAAAITLVIFSIPEPRGDTARSVDVLGALLASAGLTALTWGMTGAAEAERLSVEVWAALAAGGALLVAFLYVERARGEDAMMPLALFSSRSFIGLTALTLLLYGALEGAVVLIPYVLITARGVAATLAGASLLPLPILIAVASSTMGRLAGRFGARWLLTVGPIVVAAGCALAIRIGAASYWTSTLPVTMLIAIGMACAVAPLTTAVLTSVSRQHTGVASGLNSAISTIGGLMVVALSSGVLRARGGILLREFHVAALLLAAVAAAAGWCAFTLLREPKPG